MDKKKKTLMIAVAEEMLFRNILSTDFWPELLRCIPDWHVVLVVRPSLKEYATRLYGGERVTIEPYSRGKFSRGAETLFTFARRAIKNGTNIWSNMRAYERGDSSWIATQIKYLSMKLFGNVGWYQRLLRALILRVRSDAGMTHLFDTYRPDVFFGMSMTNFEVDVLLAIEARRRGVRVLGMTRSWDNLSSHGLFRVVPDMLFLQNRFLKDMAYLYQDMSPERPPTEIVGLPHYDHYLDSGMVASRDAFFERNGLDPNKKLILYCGMGDFLFPKEGDLIDIFEEEISSGRIKGPVQVLYSAHPKFLSSREKVASLKHLKLADEVRYTDPDATDRKDEIVHVKKLINLLSHADVVVMGASTLAIDATVLGTPVICVGFDGMGGEVPYWHSVKRFYDSYTHFEALMETGAIGLAVSVEDMDAKINSALTHHSVDSAARERLIERFVAPYDGKRALNLAQLVAKECERSS